MRQRHLAKLSLRRIVEVQTVPHAPQLDLDEQPNGLAVGPLKYRHLVEAPPQRRIKQLFVVGRGVQQTLAPVAIEELQETGGECLRRAVDAEV